MIKILKYVFHDASHGKARVTKSETDKHTKSLNILNISLYHDWSNQVVHDKHAWQTHLI